MRLPLKSLWSEFKTFAFRGNMIDLAVAVVIGGAFGTVIKAMVDDVIMPSASYAVSAVSAAAKTASDAAEDAASKVRQTKAQVTEPAASQSTTVPVSPPTAVAPVAAPPAPPPSAPDKAVEFTWMLGRIKIGDFIGALLNFVIVAFAVFIMIVKLLGSVMKRVGGTPKPSEPTTKECPECLSLIPLKAKRCAYCTAILPAVPTTPAPAE